MTKVIQALKTWWYTRVQGDVALVLGGLAVVDLSQYSEDLHELIPWSHWHAALRLTGAVLIVTRAIQARRQKRKEDDPRGDTNPA